MPARWIRMTTSSVTAASPPAAAPEEVTICAALRDTVSMIGEERRIAVNHEILRRLGLVPGDAVFTKLLEDGVLSEKRFSWIWPKEQHSLESFLYIVFGGELGAHIPHMFYRGCRRENYADKALLIILSTHDNTSMSRESQCDGWPVNVSGYGVGEVFQFSASR